MNYDWIRTRADFDEVKAAVIDPMKGTEWSYQDMNARADNLANYLHDQGIERGDVVGIFAPNDVAILDLLFASFKLGAVYLPINWRLKPQEIESVIIDSQVKMIFYAAKHLSSLQGIADDLVHMDIDSQEYDAIVDPKQHSPFKAADLESDDLAVLMYTSGTTGLPKGVMFTYDSFVNNPINLILTYRIDADYRTIIATPMFHVLGFNDLTLPLLMAGGTVILQRYFNGEALNNLMEAYQPNYLILIPTMYYAMLVADNFNPHHFENLDFLIQGGSAPLPGVQKKFNAMGHSIINGYGLTEAPLVMVNTPENGVKKPGSIGKPVMFIDIRIFDEHYEDVEVGEIGELAVRGKNVTPGYWNKPEETAKSFKDGYFLTGDLAKIDEDGDVFIVDRRKELIITGGENVLPSEVETVLSEHPLIAQCVVLGYESPKFGESVSAAIVLTENDSDYEQKLDDHMRERLAGYKIPRMYLKVTHMPLNSTSKPDKLELKQFMNKKAHDEHQQDDELV
ncbi:long-chain fatty acid--CoA ligase [Staphylococcus casei]|uniref:long-chain-fatty-acid--CoA ligase FadD n=1 Tax=Staphylococcus TaxID=1279 RepID=UPI000CD0D000|nr:AMP-binding protein [Staphylococcus casei]PNZ60003.1 long-chain fatty acid--CoA ligase [Staphylococcus casei]WJE86262.1 AMP-binding protein [Staphylococcus casei]